MKKALIAAALAGVALTGPAHALKINLIDAGGVSGSPAQMGFTIAAHYWESVLTNDAIVNFNVGFQHLGPNILGSTGSSLFTYVPVNAYQGALAATGTTSLDAVVKTHLPATDANGSLTAIVPDYSDSANLKGVANSGTRVAPSGESISNSIALTTANYKALVGSGNAALNAIVDANITFSSDFAFDFNPNNGIAAGTYDFIGVAVHEMGHALGFVSGADDFDYSTPNAGADQDFLTDQYWWGYAADMFRYTGQDELNWAFDQPAYFSIDGGATAFNGNSYFSTGSINGDSWQASHWKAPINGQGNFTCGLPFVGVMNPYICNGKVDAATANDLAFFDAIGWNPNVDVLRDGSYSFSTAQMYQARIPEPASWGMMILGFGAIGVLARRRRAPATA